MFDVSNSGAPQLGDKTESGLLYVRPQDVEIKWYEENKGYMYGDVTVESLISENVGSETGLFVNIKMHENNYYTHGTPFWPVYWTDESKSETLDPPYDTSAGEENIEIRDEDYTDSMWEFYEGAVAYVAENPEMFETVDMLDVYSMLE